MICNHTSYLLTTKLEKTLFIVIQTTEKIYLKREIILFTCCHLAGKIDTHILCTFSSFFIQLLFELNI